MVIRRFSMFNSFIGRTPNIRPFDRFANALGVPPWGSDYGVRLPRRVNAELQTTLFTWLTRLDSNQNAGSFSSACTMKRFPPRCASAIQIAGLRLKFN